MQSKVSIVMPCYNKGEYIGNMLNSIVSQKWDNVEVILVNDGSTDSTGEIIKAYEPTLNARGYETILVEQKNSGCCSAVKAGLDRVSGEYLCVIDADDELDPEYISTMAGWLDTHSECDYCSCDYIVLKKQSSCDDNEAFQPRPWPRGSFTPEFFLCNDQSKAAWAFMTRMDYIRKCRLIETFYVDTRGSYEPSFFIPFTVYGGSMKHFSLSLYRYSSDVGGLSQNVLFDKINSYWREYHRVVLLMLELIPDKVLNPYKRKYLESLSSFYTIKNLLLASLWTKGGKRMTEGLRQEFISYVNNWLSISPRISYDDICEHPIYVCRAVELELSGIGGNFLEPPKRIIGYGALGRAAKRILPCLKGTEWEPSELWDKAGDGVTIKRPDFSSLREGDAVIVLPTTQSIIDEVKDKLDLSRAKVFYHSDINDLISMSMFPQFKNKGVK